MCLQLSATMFRSVCVANVVNPNRTSGVESRKRFDANPAIIPLTPAAELMPNVVHRIPLDTSEAERGILTTGQPMITTHIAQACAALERTLQCCCSAAAQHGRQQLRRERALRFASDGGRDRRVSVVSYPPRSACFNVCLELRASYRQVDRQHHTRQIK